MVRFRCKRSPARALLLATVACWTLLTGQGAPTEAGPLALTLQAAPSELGANDWRLTYTGPDGDTGYQAISPAVAYGRRGDQYLAVWAADAGAPGLARDEFEIYAQRIAAANLAPTGPVVRISAMGPDGDAAFCALDPAVAYDDQHDQFLVVWTGGDDLGALVSGEREIWGQRVAAASGALVGARLRLSDMGADGDASRGAARPAVVYNAVSDEFLVVWHGDDALDNVIEVYGQRLAAGTGAEVGPNDFAISQMGADPSDPRYRGQYAAVAYNRIADEYLVVWEGTVDEVPLVAEAYEIYGQRLSAAGAKVGSVGFRISDMGPEGSGLYAARRPAVAHDPLANAYLVVWSGDDNRDWGQGPLADEELEVYGQRLSAQGVEIGANDLRISSMGPDGDPAYKAFAAQVGYVPGEGYLVVWRGDDNRAYGGAPLADDELEIYAQTLASDGAETGNDDWRLSDMGDLDGSAQYGADRPALALRGCRGQALVLWQGDDQTGALVDNEVEVFGQGLEVADASGAQPTVSLRGGPAVFCPGWNLHYLFAMDNNTACALTDVRISVALPPDTCCLLDGAGSTVPGVLQPGEQSMVWQVAALAPGEQVRIELSLHPHSNLPTGHVVTTTFGYQANELGAWQQEQVASVADRALCAQATATPTATATADPRATPTNTGSPEVTPTATEDPNAAETTPTPTPTSTIQPTDWLYLPLMVK